MRKAGQGYSRGLGSVVSFRITPEERKALEAKARRDDRDLGVTVRKMLRDAIDAEAKAQS